MEIIFVTGNENKLNEAKKILETGKIKVIGEKIELDEYQGDIKEIAKKKAKHACEILGKPCFVDDASLCFDSLNGMPGPYIKYFENSMKTENLPRLIDFSNDKKASAIISIGYCKPNSEPICFTGETRGKIVEAKGDNGFGWDKIFVPNGYDKTFAEMTKEEKNKISHRKLALEKLKEFLLNVK
jgi:inosine triphosphate pyrophosphatase